MINILLSIIVPLSIYIFLPILIKYLTGNQPRRNFILILACLLYFISWYLPSPLIEGRDTDFSTHLVGGGIFSGFIWLYLKGHLKLNFNLPADLISLLALVSLLGVTSELFELLLVKLSIFRISLTDTSWDLVANTLGALIFWTVYRSIKYFRSINTK